MMHSPIGIRFCNCVVLESQSTKKIVLLQGDTKEQELLKCIVAAMYSWQHCRTGPLSYRQPCHPVTMEQWNSQQRAFAIKMIYKNNDSLEGAQREFRRFLNLGRHGQVPSKHVIKTWINNFEETGSALKKKPTGWPRSAHTPQNIEQWGTSTADWKNAYMEEDAIYRM